MKYYSTRSDKKAGVSLSYAVLKGLADDGGLYMPEYIPKLEDDFIKNLHTYTLQEMAFIVAKAFIEDEVPEDILREMINDTLNFPIPLVKVEQGVYSLELYHGPTMAFKDVGARFMARLMSYFSSDKNKKVMVIAATSGDTGSAVAAGFYNMPSIEVCILYPQGKVSPLQEKQLTTWGGNITAIEVQGTFDDCQKLAKELLADKELQDKYTLTSANSINIARLIPQSFYYFYAYAQLSRLNKPVVISVPSGNFGNITAGLLAKRMGLPIHTFIASTNINDVVPEFLKTGKYNPQPSIQTISNAMDVGNPSNFERMNSLYNGELSQFAEYIKGYAFTDDATRQALKKVYTDIGYLFDPHGAVAYLGLKKFMAENKTSVNGIFFETAHPAKFLEVVNDILSTTITVPDKLLEFDKKTKQSIICPNDFKDVKSAVISR